MSISLAKRGKLYVRFLVALAFLAASFYSFSVFAFHSDYPASSLVRIVSAEHRSGFSLSADIYELVSRHDNQWARIPAGDTVRVKFERPLNSSDDLTLFARGSGSVDVSLPGSSSALVSFESISGEGSYKVLLTELGGLSSQSFDLKVRESFVEFDLVVDPDVSACGTLSSSGTHTLTGNISGSGTCITIGLDNITLDYAGHNISYGSNGAGFTYGVDDSDNFHNLMVNCTWGDTL